MDCHTVRPIYFLADKLKDYSVSVPRRYTFRLVFGAAAQVCATGHPLRSCFLLSTHMDDFDFGSAGGGDGGGGGREIGPLYSYDK